MKLQFFIGALWMVFVGAALNGIYPVAFWLLSFMVLACGILNEMRLSNETN